MPSCIPPRPFAGGRLFLVQSAGVQPTALGWARCNSEQRLFFRANCLLQARFTEDPCVSDRVLPVLSKNGFGLLLLAQAPRSGNSFLSFFPNVRVRLTLETDANPMIRAFRPQNTLARNNRHEAVCVVGVYCGRIGEDMPSCRPAFLQDLSPVGAFFWCSQPGSNPLRWDGHGATANRGFSSAQTAFSRRASPRTPVFQIAFGLLLLTQAPRSGNYFLSFFPNVRVRLTLETDANPMIRAFRPQNTLARNNRHEAVCVVGVVNGSGGEGRAILHSPKTLRRWALFGQTRFIFCSCLQNTLARKNRREVVCVAGVVNGSGGAFLQGGVFECTGAKRPVR
ncbi:hypothetical protein DIPPA_12410 [Diplonema papillatum]|nr:hypothetical protein DIPPA_12410 [Diplonema papillatum]